MTLVLTAFNKNDIRGIVNENLNEEIYALATKAYVKFATAKLEKKPQELVIGVAMDARNHSPGFTKVVIDTLVDAGVNVLDFGLCPTPLGYFSEFSGAHTHGAMIITASHNPSEYNGMKMTLAQKSLTEEEIFMLRDMLVTEKFESAEIKGTVKKYDIAGEYIEKTSRMFQHAGQGLKVVVDSGNATAGIAAPELYRKMSCDVIDIFTEPDGNFPNHHPDPSKEKNLQHLKEKIKETGADFGIAFDGDSDRIGVVDNTGYAIPGDQLLLILALDILKSRKISEAKPVIISEVKCSQTLFDTIDKNGGRSIMWKTGHAYIKNKMREENAVLAGEMSGHIFFKDRYYGFDDAIYAGCRMIEIMAKHKAHNPNYKLSDLIESLPKAFTSPEVRFACPNEYKFILIDKINEKIEQNSNIFGSKIEKIITLDGLRIVFTDGFGLIRASNTEPTLTLRFEGSTSESCNNYKDSIISIIESTLEELKNV
ncbi:MAG: phosphomannomutase/phosphoglucomutase [bacterium]